MSPIVRNAGTLYATKAGRNGVAYEGDVIDADVLADGELERLRSLGVFDEPEGRRDGPHDPSEEERSALVGDQVAPVVDDGADMDALTENEVDEWMGERPPVAEVMRVVGNDSARAQAALDSEKRVTDGQPRSTLVRELERIIAGGA